MAVGWPAKPGEKPNKVCTPVKNPTGKGVQSRPTGKPPTPKPKA